LPELLPGPLVVAGVGVQERDAEQVLDGGLPERLIGGGLNGAQRAHRLLVGAALQQHCRLVELEDPARGRRLAARQLGGDLGGERRVDARWIGDVDHLGTGLRLDLELYGSRAALHLERGAAARTLADEGVVELGGGEHRSTAQSGDLVTQHEAGALRRAALVEPRHHRSCGGGGVDEQRAEQRTGLGDRGREGGGEPLEGRALLERNAAPVRATGGRRGRPDPQVGGARHQVVGEDREHVHRPRRPLVADRLRSVPVDLTPLGLTAGGHLAQGLRIEADGHEQLRTLRRAVDERPTADLLERPLEAILQLVCAHSVPSEDPHEDQTGLELHVEVDALAVCDRDPGLEHAEGPLAHRDAVVVRRQDELWPAGLSDAWLDDATVRGDDGAEGNPIEHHGAGFELEEERLQGMVAELLELHPADEGAIAVEAHLDLVRTGLEAADDQLADLVARLEGRRSARHPVGRDRLVGGALLDAVGENRGAPRPGPYHEHRAGALHGELHGAGLAGGDLDLLREGGVAGTPGLHDVGAGEHCDRPRTAVEGLAADRDRGVGRLGDDLEKADHPLLHGVEEVEQLR
jgi:hypothetical protein